MKIQRTLVALFLGLSLAAPAGARDDGERTVDVAILDVLLQRGIIDEATYEELLLLAERQHRMEQELDLLQGQLLRLRRPDLAVQGGKPGKTTFVSEDGRYSMTIKGRIQLQADKVEGEDRGDDLTNFSVRRGRVALEGRAGLEGLAYKFEFDAATSTSIDGGTKDFALTDAYLDQQLDGGLAVRGGQFKFPFGREVQIYSSKGNLVDESLASKTFAPNREPGAMVYGEHGENGLVQWWAGVSNGDGQGRANTSGVTQPEDTPAEGLRRGLRVVVNPFGALDRSMTAFQTAGGEAGPKLALGASVMHNDDLGFDFDATPGREVRGDATVFGYEGQLFLGPLSLFAERFSSATDLDSGLGDIDGDGYTVQAGLLLGEDNGYEVVLRRSVVDIDLVDKIVQDTLGFNVFNAGHDSKWAFDVTDESNRDAGDSDRTIYRVQYQQVF